MPSLQPVTVVTGAAGALGTEVSQHLLHLGHTVAAVDRHPERLADLEQRHAARLLALTLDVAAPAAWKEALSRIEGKLGPVTGAVLCAGAWGGGKNVADEADDSMWRRMMDANLETAQASIRALLPGLVDRGRGSLVVIGSRAVERPWESAGAAAYAAAKSGLVAYAQAIAQEVLESGVRVNAVLPSMINTEANRAAMPDADFSRWVPAESLARVIGFLLSDDAADVSGAAIPVYSRV